MLNSLLTSLDEKKCAMFYLQKIIKKMYCPVGTLHPSPGITLLCDVTFSDIGKIFAV
jgi:hypothetical protein